MVGIFQFAMLVITRWWWCPLLKCFMSHFSFAMPLPQLTRIDPAWCQAVRLSSLGPPWGADLQCPRTKISGVLADHCRPWAIGEGPRDAEGPMFGQDIPGILMGLYIHIAVITFSFRYHLVMTNIANWKIPTINGGFDRWEHHLFLWAIYTMAMLNHQRVSLIEGFANPLGCGSKWKT